MLTTPPFTGTFCRSVSVQSTAQPCHTRPFDTHVPVSSLVVRKNVRLRQLTTKQKERSYNALWYMVGIRRGEVSGKD